jgi:hypothetical protein
MRHEEISQLLLFIEAAKAKGASDEFLATFFARRGWPEDDVHAALGRYWERQTGMSIPERRAGGESSRDAFLYLLAFTTLATWAGALGSMFFQFIDYWIPDPVTAQAGLNLRALVTWQMASIAVAFPVFLLTMRTILGEAQDHSERLQSGVRKWLTYIALLLTAGGMIGDLIWFLDYFLTGELTARFILKSLTVMLICGAIFIYYSGSLHWDRDTNFALVRMRSLRFGAGAAIAVVAAFSIGLGVAGTPAIQRGIEADNRRVQDLRAIAWALHNRHQRPANAAEPLPATLDELAGKGIRRNQLTDPQTGAAYEYRVQSGTVYDLCAMFASAGESDQVTPNQFWYHGKGRVCFTLDAARPPAW